MKIKRYAAPTMRAALAQVRSEQGPDAVILSSRRGEDGIEVIAAVDYDEALFVDANGPRQARSVSAPVIAPAPTAPIVKLPNPPMAKATPRPAARPPAPATSPRPATGAALPLEAGY